ncbi:MAG: type I 3-dehydroquinate dehydratase [Lachnospiraceae bacterium]|nr:type I 3-dehydroquinate dehydratase [Lachnospiraceae bacterium]
MIKVKNLEIGTGRPKICVPVIEKTRGDILAQAKCMKEKGAELVEWRADFFDEVQNPECVLEVLLELQCILTELPLLFTFRTAKEGGEKHILWEQYETLLKAVAESGTVELIDVEIFRGYDERLHQKKEWRVTDVCNRRMLDLMDELKRKVVLIGSYHDFEKTPSQEEILRRFLFIDRMGADIPKMAVMPKEREDVLRLMEAACLAERLIMEKPLIAMSMGALGAITRVSGETFGSAVTFGCVGKESAPGQLEAGRLRSILDTLHRG